VACILEAVCQIAEAFGRLKRGTIAVAGGHDVQGQVAAGAV